MYGRISILSLLIVLTPAFAALPHVEPIPNADFSKGSDKPDSWVLSGGTGQWIDRNVLSVTGDGQDMNHWRCEGYRFAPGRLYHIAVRARRPRGTGTMVCGPTFANRDFTGLGKDWGDHGFVFRTPENAGGGYLRLGQWHVNGTVEFDNVRLTRAMPLHNGAAGLELGEGESIRDGVYTFHPSFNHYGSNYHRTLQSSTTAFNSNRWCFTPGSEVIYRFEIPGHKQLTGRVSFTVNYHQGGGVIAELSRDQNQWQPVTTVNKAGGANVDLPADLFPADRVFLRFRGLPERTSLQINQITYEAKLGSQPLDAMGRTDFADITSTSPTLAIERITTSEVAASGEKQIDLLVKNTAQQNAAVTLTGTITVDQRDPKPIAKKTWQIPGGDQKSLAVKLPAENPGQHQVFLRLAPPTGPPFESGLTYFVPDYYRADYGRRIAGASSKKVGVWFCDATRKVPPHRALPEETTPSASVSAAKHDHEAVQIIVRPKDALTGLRATASDLRGPHGAIIAADNVKILRVAYHDVHSPTDRIGVRGRWPDALPPLTRPIDVPADENQPLWILIYVPESAKAGDYDTQLTLQANGWSAKVPIRLHVWDFALPKRNHIETAFGFNPGNVFRYHQLKTDADKRRQLDLYWQSFSEHRISPYNPAPMDPIRVKFRDDTNPPKADLDFSAFDPAMTRAVEKYHFTGYRLPIAGMGGGTFHARYRPKIGKFTEEAPEYQALFASYVKQLENHLRGKGWLDLAYVYWFDEPAPRDYEFVINGMRRLKSCAPGLRRMLTEEPGDELGGWVDIWCPVTPNYHHDQAEKRRAHGERFWWYVCTGPKAPYCTLFIDHPATELRIWLWQTWQRNIDGILVWAANYWTSSAAFPDKPQNPYADPMGYCTGYSTPKGTRRHWGNGDGRFIYPPEAAANADRGPVLEPPVSSIRWEMLREGIEDYEFLHLLRDLLRNRRSGLRTEIANQIESLLLVPESITKDMTTFTTDPTPIYKHRAAIARAIERLLP